MFFASVRTRLLLPKGGGGGVGVWLEEGIAFCVGKIQLKNFPIINSLAPDMGEVYNGNTITMLPHFRG